VWNTYGITETGSWMAGPKVNDEIEPIDGLIGYGWGTEIIISNLSDMNGISENKKASLPSGEKGYVWLRTSCVMHEYWNRSIETENVLQGSWFYTGDVGMIDEKGRLVLTGRKRNEINKGGMKVSPEELDVIFERHLAILEACAFAVEDKILGQNIGICCVFDKDLKKPSLSELKKWSIKNVSDYKIPTIWYDVKTIPKTSRGKIKRNEVSDYCSTIKSMQK
jgi:acyl-CoA synthetase (AMP-forming)/AMP-acid ligase II